MKNLSDLKIIFLDIDGVLNIYSGINNTYIKYGSHFGKEHINLLNDLFNKNSDIYIVISSSWRDDMEDLIYLLNEANFKYTNRIIGNTALNNKFRGEQIQDYINEHNIKLFCILDDDMTFLSDKYSGCIPNSKCVEVNSKLGITSSDIQKVISILSI